MKSLFDNRAKWSSRLPGVSFSPREQFVLYVKRRLITLVQPIIIRRVKQYSLCYGIRLAVKQQCSTRVGRTLDSLPCPLLDDSRRPATLNPAYE